MIKERYRHDTDVPQSNDNKSVRASLYDKLGKSLRDALNELLHYEALYLLSKPFNDTLKPHSNGPLYSGWYTGR